MLAGVLAFGTAVPQSATARNSVEFKDVAVTTVMSPLRPQGFTVSAMSQDGRLAAFAGISDRSLITLDLQTGKTNSIDSIGTNPWDVALSPDGSTAYVLLLRERELVGFDTNTLAVRTQITFADYAGTASFALSPDGNRAYVLVTRAFLPPTPATKSLVILDLSSGAVVQSIQLGSVLTSSGLRSANSQVAAPRDSPWVYVVDQFARAIQIVDPIAGKVVRSLPFDGDPSALAVSTDGSKVLVLSKDRDSVTLFDSLSGAKLWESSTYPGSPGGAVIDDTNGFAYVTLEYTGTIVRFDLQTGAAERRTFANVQLGEPALVDNDQTLAVPITPTSVLLLQPALSQKQSRVRLPAPERVRAQWKNGSVSVFWNPILGDRLPAAESFTVTTQPESTTCTAQTNSCVFANLKRGQTYRFLVTAHLGNASSKTTRSRPFTVPR